MRKQGLAFHCHHDTLCEYVYDYNERVRSIKRDKPRKEQQLRLHLFQLIPNDRLPKEVVDAVDAYGKAVDAYGKVWDAYNKARHPYYKARGTYGKVWDAYSKAYDAYNKARHVLNKARDALSKAIADNYKYLEALHKELCPDCPWDGETIFSEEGK